MLGICRIDGHYATYQVLSTGQSIRFTATEKRTLQVQLALSAQGVKNAMT